MCSILNRSRRRAQVPEIAVVMLACTRIGAAHSVVFAGFSADSLRDRIVDANSKWIVTSDEGKRGGRTLPLKKIVDDACVGASTVEKVFYFKRTNATVPLTPGRDVDMDELSAQQRPYCPCEMMDSEDLLFILYTSGSTGRPKGVAHTTAGYLLYAAMTTKHVFDLREGDVYACVADAGWITGHSYIVYGPLLNGTTTVMFESTPMYPDHGRYWDMVQRHKINVFYTAPTAIRAPCATGRRRWPSTTSRRSACSDPSVSPSTPRRGGGTSSTSARSAAPSSTRGGRPRRAGTWRRRSRASRR